MKNNSILSNFSALYNPNFKPLEFEGFRFIFLKKPFIFKTLTHLRKNYL
jgi:hypothetical protein